MPDCPGDFAAVLAPPPRMGKLETLPKWLNLIPMVLQWLWLGARYRSVSLPTAINPGILAGGLVGETKTEYFVIMGDHARARVAAFTVFANSGCARQAARALAAADLGYPIVAKPDIGWCGYGVRVIENASQLAGYVAGFPPGERIVLQRFLPQRGEAGLYYARAPGEAHGRLIGLLLRHGPQVIGDGVRSIGALIAADPRLRRLGRNRGEACCDPSRVPRLGEAVRVALVGSIRAGGRYEDATASITAALTAAVDAIAQDMEDFYLGRFDVRFESLVALAAGDFTIIEVNGVGSEAVHAWDPRLNLRQAYGIVFAKQRLLFALGAAMRRQGHQPIGWWRLVRLYLRQRRLIRAYPHSN